MKSLFITIFSIILLSSCITIVDPRNVEKKEPEVVVKPEVVEKPEVKTQILNPWPIEKKNFHIAMYFARMAQDPGLRQRYHPPNLYNICKCVLDQMERDLEYDKFISEYDGSNVTPATKQYIYGITYNCSVEEVKKMKAQQPEFDLKNMALKEEETI
jgi:hypothetical protein